jgi:hypothetical protein
MLISLPASAAAFYSSNQMKEAEEYLISEPQRRREHRGKKKGKRER